MQKSDEQHAKGMAAQGREDISQAIADIKIIGSGLCVTAMQVGLVSLYSFETGEHLFDLNTHSIYQFPYAKVRKAIYYRS